MQPRLFEEWIERGHQRDANLCGACARPTDKRSLVRGGGGYNQGSCVYFSKGCGDWMIAGVGCLPEATIMSWMSWRNWPATQATLCASTTRCRRLWPQATLRAMSSLSTEVLITLTTVSLMFQSAATTSVIAQLTMYTSRARCKPMSISRNVLGSKSSSTVLIMLLLVWSLHLQLCQWLAKFIPSFFISCGSWLTNRHAITMRSSARRRRLTARHSCGVELARLV